MKKLLIIMAMTFFAATAFAANMDFSGYYYVEGRYLTNHQLVKEHGNTKAFYMHKLRLYGVINIDEKTSVTIRWEPIYDDVFGNTVKSSATPNRAFATYYVIPSLKLQGGKLTGGLWGTDFGRGAGRLDGKEYGARDGFHITYGIDESYKNNVMLFAYKLKEDFLTSDAFDGSRRDNGAIKANAKDTDQFGIAYTGTFGDLKIMPTYAFTHFVNEATIPSRLERTSTHEFNLGAAYAPKTGLQAEAAVIYVTGTKDQRVHIDGKRNLDIATYGLYADLGYAANSFDAGVYFATASFDKKKGHFNFGGNFDRTTVIDDWYFDETGVPAMMVVGGYGNIAVMSNLAIKPVVAYYMSNVSKDHVVNMSAGGNTIDAGYIGKDTTILEADLNAEYSMTSNVTLSGGYSYVKINDIYTAANTKFDADGLHRVSWKMNFAF